MIFYTYFVIMCKNRTTDLFSLQKQNTAAPRCLIYLTFVWVGLIPKVNRGSYKSLLKQKFIKLYLNIVLGIFWSYVYQEKLQNQTECQ